MKERVGSVLLTLLCVGLAALDYFREKPLRVEFLGLIFFAVLPWVLPLLPKFFKSVKFGDMEFEFRELKSRIEENRDMIQATAAAVVGVGKDPRRAGAGHAATLSTGPPEAVSHSIPAAEDDDNVTATGTKPHSVDSEDPNFALFGNKPVAGGRSLSATVKPFPASEEWFVIRAQVSSTDPDRPLKDGTVVTFYLHPTFDPAKVAVRVVGGVAVLERVSWGWFTLGAEVEGVRLGLPLNTVPGAPALFKSR